MADRVSKIEGLIDLKRVATELGHPPTIAEYREHGSFSTPTIAQHFDGSFTAARAEALDCPDERQAEHRREELLADIERVAEQVGREPSRGDYEECGGYALSTITYRFESWIDAKQEAGVYEGINEGPTREELLEDLQRVDTEIDGALSQKSYNDYGEWSTRPVKRRFESWEAACQEAGVTRPKMGPQTEKVDALFEDIRHVAEELQHVPSRTEYHKHGRFSREMARQRVGSWPKAVRKAGFEPRAPGGQPGEMNSNWKGGYEPYYGKNWYKQRRAARERDGYECVVCGMPDEEHESKFGWRLEVHHIVPVREFDEPEDANRLENLITLCRPHHQMYENLPVRPVQEVKKDE